MIGHRPGYRLVSFMVPVLLLALAGCSSPEPTPTAKAIPTALPTQTPEPTDTPLPTPTAPPTNTPSATSTPMPTATPAPTATPSPTETPVPTETPEPTETSVPTATPPPTPTATQPPPTPIPAPSVFETFLGDARQTEADLWEIRNWFDQAEYVSQSWKVSCGPIPAHSIHQPVSLAPAEDPELGGIWHEYLAALGNGQEVLDWFLEACTGRDEVEFRNMDYIPRRRLASVALGQSEHVVTALEALQ